jgi:hypothetical protein
MAKCQYSPDSGRNPHSSVSMTCANIPVPDRVWSIAGLASCHASTAAEHTSAVATKAASFINVTPNN